MVLTEQDALTLHDLTAELKNMLEHRPGTPYPTAVDWKAFIAKLIEAIGPQLLALLIALLSEKQTT